MTRPPVPLSTPFGALVLPHRPSGSGSTGTSGSGSGNVSGNVSGPSGSAASDSSPGGAPSVGEVWLVGGGPGDPDLLTVRARRLLDEADVVVHDRLGPVSVLTELPESVQLVDVGKRPHHHPVPQEEINQLLVDHAKRGRKVVRLKGGDPFVLGRGGEELAACHEAGVACHVVPGISSAVAAPAAAGIPVTHRGLSTGVVTVSGHDELDLPALATTPHTVVVLMGMGRLHEITAGLVRHGRDPQTPAAVIQQAWTPWQREVRAPLSELAGAVAREGLTNPAVIVVGAVAGLPAQVSGVQVSGAQVSGVQVTGAPDQGAGASAAAGAPAGRLSA